MGFKGCPLIFTEFNLGDAEDDLRLVQALAENASTKLEVRKGSRGSI